jgi:PAS domain S-box-containing protein
MCRQQVLDAVALRQGGRQCNYRPIIREVLIITNVLVNPLAEAGENFSGVRRAVQKDGLKEIQNTKPKPALKGQFIPLRLLVTIIGGVFLAEVFAMIVVYFYRSLPYPQQVLLDATVMTVIIFPLLYLLATRPLLKHIQQRTQTENILKARLRLIQYANSHTIDELLQAALDEIESLTDSQVGYFHFLDPDQKTLRLRAWSTNTLQNMCTLSNRDRHYDLDQAGVWADCIRERQPVIHNDYASLKQRKGYPEGHAPIIRELSVPIMREEQIVGILGMGNKPQKYNANDVELVTRLADFAWDVIEHKQAGENLLASEEKFRTLADWTYDWESWIDPQGDIVYNSPSCQRITGYSPEEFIHDPGLLMDIVHPDDRDAFTDHQQALHDGVGGITKLEYRIVSRDGAERWIEHICRPLFGRDNRYLGRRISNREITERKQAARELNERNEKEKLLTQTIHNMQLDIARDLHDTLGQNISYLRLRLAHLAGKRTRKQIEVQAELQNMARAADESYDLIRGTLAILQSVNSADLYRLFTRYAEQIEERAGFKLTCASRGEPQPLSAPRMRQLFYIYREALNNIEKHAEAALVKMEMLWDPDGLNLIVTDNGKGFETGHARFGTQYGLKFMRERVELLGGTLTIQSEAGMGTRVEVQIPYE